MVESSAAGVKYISSPEPIRSVQDLRKIIKPYRKDQPLLFRGQNIDKPLLPLFARKATALALRYPLQTEKKLISEFKRQSLPHLTIPAPATDWDWLTVARHHGLPTRLLDWTANAEVALWFAVMQPVPPESGSGALWILRPDSEDFRSPGPTVSLFDLERTFIFQPAYVTRRIAAQDGWFSVHKYVEKRDKFIALEKNVNFAEKLTRHVVSLDAFDQIRSQLQRKRLTRFSLYQDLDSLSIHLIESNLSN